MGRVEASPGTQRGDGERDLEVNKGLKINDVWSILASETGGQVGEETLDV